MVAYIIKEEYENKSLKELIEDRNNLLIKLKKFEDEYIFNTPEIAEYTKPSPETSLLWHVNWLQTLTAWFPAATMPSSPSPVLDAKQPTWCWLKGSENSTLQ